MTQDVTKDTLKTGSETASDKPPGNAAVIGSPPTGLLKMRYPSVKYRRNSSLASVRSRTR